MISRVFFTLEWSPRKNYKWLAVYQPMELKHVWRHQSVWMKCRKPHDEPTTSLHTVALLEIYRTMREFNFLSGVIWFSGVTKKGLSGVYMEPTGVTVRRLKAFCRCYRKCSVEANTSWRRSSVLQVAHRSEIGDFVTPRQRMLCKCG